MINLTWQDDCFGNLVLTPQLAWEFNILDFYDWIFDSYH